MMISIKGKTPKVGKSVFIAPSATVVGAVEIGDKVGVWYGAVIRADSNSIAIGDRSNVQDNSVLHTEHSHPLVVGSDVTIGHRAIVHGCKIGNRVLVGMGSIIMNGAEISDDCIVGAGALITEGVKIPPRSLVLGSPGKVKRELTEEEVSLIGRASGHYEELAKMYIEEGKGI
jgi:carbonic anhydrase/acetyltransferase-like protein (isoleucine patch superfamily)